MINLGYFMTLFQPQRLYSDKWDGNGQWWIGIMIWKEVITVYFKVLSLIQL